jgi:hypothetical protein
MNKQNNQSKSNPQIIKERSLIIKKTITIMMALMMETKWRPKQKAREVERPKHVLQAVTYQPFHTVSTPWQEVLDAID